MVNDETQSRTQCHTFGIALCEAPPTEIPLDGVVVRRWRVVVSVVASAAAAASAAHCAAMDPAPTAASTLPYMSKIAVIPVDAVGA